MRASRPHFTALALMVACAKSAPEGSTTSSLNSGSAGSSTGLSTIETGQSSGASVSSDGTSTTSGQTSTGSGSTGSGVGSSGSSGSSGGLGAPDRGCGDHPILAFCDATNDCGCGLECLTGPSDGRSACNLVCQQTAQCIAFNPQLVCLGGACQLPPVCNPARGRSAGYACSSISDCACPMVCSGANGICGAACEDDTACVALNPVSHCQVDGGGVTICVADDRCGGAGQLYDSCDRNSVCGCPLGCAQGSCSNTCLTDQDCPNGFGLPYTKCNQDAGACYALCDSTTAAAPFSLCQGSLCGCPYQCVDDPVLNAGPNTSPICELCDGGRCQTLPGACTPANPAAGIVPTENVLCTARGGCVCPDNSVVNTIIPPDLGSPVMSCQRACTQPNDCPTSSSCSDGGWCVGAPVASCSSVGSLPPGSCSNNPSICCSGLECVTGTGFLSNDFCAPSCKTDSDCADPGTSCLNGVCVDDPGSCALDSGYQLNTGSLCQTSANVAGTCVADLPSTAAGTNPANAADLVVSRCHRGGTSAQACTLGAADCRPGLDCFATLQGPRCLPPCNQTAFGYQNLEAAGLLPPYHAPFALDSGLCSPGATCVLSTLLALSSRDEEGACVSLAATGCWPQNPGGEFQLCSQAADCACGLQCQPNPAIPPSVSSVQFNCQGFGNDGNAPYLSNWVCQPSCQTSQECPRDQVCLGSPGQKFCQFNFCVQNLSGQYEPLANFGGACDADGVGSGNCGPFDRGQIPEDLAVVESPVTPFDICQQAGTASSACNPAADRQHPELTCPTGQYCGPQQGCVTLCDLNATTNGSGLGCPDGGGCLPLPLTGAEASWSAVAPGYCVSQ